MSDTELRAVLTTRLAAVRSRIAAACARANRDPSEVTLVAVTKTVSPRVARLMVELGVLDLGENRPQELWRKAEALADQVWMIDRGRVVPVDDPFTGVEEPREGERSDGDRDGGHDRRRDERHGHAPAQRPVAHSPAPPSRSGR